MPTYLVSDGEGGMKAVVLDDGAASLRGADGADVRHAQGVAGVVAAEVLDRRSAVSFNKHFTESQWRKTHHRTRGDNCV